MAAFTVHNASDTLARDVAYSMQAREAELNLSSPQSGYVRSDQAVPIRGEVKKSVKKLLVQLKKGNQSWERVIRATDGKFQEQIPLLFGQGVHQLDVMRFPTRKNGVRSGKEPRCMWNTRKTSSGNRLPILIFMPKGAFNWKRRWPAAIRPACPTALPDGLMRRHL